MSVLPSLGGTARAVGPGCFFRVSPDGRRFATFCAYSKFVEVRDAETGAVTDSVRVPGEYLFLTSGVDWSPDGRLLVVGIHAGERRFMLQTVRLVDGRSRALLTDSVELWSPRWSPDGATIYYLREAGYAWQVWKMPVVASSGAGAGGPAIVLPLLEGTVGFHGSFDLVESGRHLAFTRVSRRGNLSVVTADSTAPPRVLTVGSAFVDMARFSPDGSRVAFVQGDATSRNVFVARVDSGAPRQLTYLSERQASSLDWSPNGRLLVYCSNGEAGPQLEMTSLTGHVTSPVMAGVLSQTCEVGWLSNDEVLYHRSGNRNFGVVSLAGHPEQLLVPHDSVGWMFDPRADPSGTRVAVRWNPSEFGLWVISRADSSARLLAPGNYTPVRWAADGRSLYAWGRTGLTRLALEGGAAEPVTFSACRGALEDISADGTRALCITGEWTSDAWLIRDFDPTARALPRPR